MKIGTDTKTLIPSTAKLLDTKRSFIGELDPKKNSVKMETEDSFDVDGDGVADIERHRLYSNVTNFRGDLTVGAKLERQTFNITDKTTDEFVMAEDANGSGKLSSVLAFGRSTFSFTGEKDLDGNGTVDKKLELVDGKVRISTSTRRDGIFDLVESPKDSFGW